MFIYFAAHACMSLALNGAIFQQRGPCMGDVGDPFKDGGKCSIVKDTCT